MDEQGLVWATGYMDYIKEGRLGMAKSVFSYVNRSMFKSGTVNDAIGEPNI